MKSELEAKVEPKCNPHPKAPHGFNRNASHSADRYVCECEGWDAYDAGYQAGIEDTYKRMDEPKQEAKVEPVAWDGYNLDDMCEAFNRVIEEHCHKKHPFHDPVNNDAMIALRTLRGFIPYMKRHTTPPQRTWVGLTDEEYKELHLQMGAVYFYQDYGRAIEAKLKEKNG